MTYNNYLKNDITIRYLEKIIKKEHLSHSYIFSHPDCEVLEHIIIKFIKSIFCENNKKKYFSCDDCIKCNQINNSSYIDLLIVDSDGSIKKEDILIVKEELKLKPIFSKKIYWVKNIDRMTTQAGNSILKFLEEPEDDIIAIFSTVNISKVLPTIISRCSVVNIASNRNNTLEKIQENEFINIINNYIFEYTKNKNLAFFNLVSILSKKEDINSFFKSFIMLLSNEVKYDKFSDENYIYIYKLILNSIRELEINVSPILVLESFCINTIMKDINFNFLNKESVYY